MIAHFKVRPHHSTGDIEIDSYDVMGKRVLSTPITVTEAKNLVTQIAMAVDDLKNDRPNVKLHQT